MGRFFRNDLHDEFGSWPLGYTATGGPDVGLIAAVGAAVGDGDDGAFHAAWMAAGDRLAREAQAAGHRPSAGELWLAAAACYATSYHPLNGAPVDPRLPARGCAGERRPQLIVTNGYDAPWPRTTGSPRARQRCSTG
jgi:hypothetical protein